MKVLVKHWQKRAGVVTATFWCLFDPVTPESDYEFVGSLTLYCPKTWKIIKRWLGKGAKMGPISVEFKEIL